MTYQHAGDGKVRIVIQGADEPRAPKPIAADAPLKERIIHAIRHVQDPEIPLNVYDLGLIYDIALNAGGGAVVTMTLTAPNCPVADDIVRQVQERVAAVDGIQTATVNLVFDPPWTKAMMSDAAKLELGLL